MNDKIRNLQEKAKTLELLLEVYAKVNSDASMVLGFMKPLLMEIYLGEIVPPKKFDFRWHFSNTESPLYVLYDLGEAAAAFGQTLEDWPISS